MQKLVVPPTEYLPEERLRLIMERLAQEGRVVALDLARNGKQQFRCVFGLVSRGFSERRELAGVSESFSHGEILAASSGLHGLPIKSFDGEPMWNVHNNIVIEFFDICFKFVIYGHW